MTTDIASRIPGRSVHSYDLLDEAVDTYGLTRAQAHGDIHAFLAQIVDIDGDDTILATEPMRPELLVDNPRDLDVYCWLTISDETADAIREALAAAYGEQ
ncbi:hypothetical protein [Kitasatospora fiedleri]|uniref:hypothetical protein n=1 Tax=Kitasatospora fiedleri TaxID=2991545 RepID=UPI00249B1C1F|nr:hypothetical protein [Kitasatospora fiedleri]